MMDRWAWWEPKKNNVGEIETTGLYSRVTDMPVIQGPMLISTQREADIIIQAPLVSDLLAEVELLRGMLRGVRAR